MEDCQYTTPLSPQEKKDRCCEHANTIQQLRDHRVRGPHGAELKLERLQRAAERERWQRKVEELRIAADQRYQEMGVLRGESEELRAGNKKLGEGVEKLRGEYEGWRGRTKD